MSFYVVTFGPGPLYCYRRLETLQATRRDALVQLIRWTLRRATSVFLRDGATGKRISVGEAKRELGFTFVESWQPQQWLDRCAA